MQQAIVSCQNGIKAAAKMKAEWEPSLAAIQKREVEIRAAREALNDITGQVVSLFDRAFPVN